MRCPGQDWGYWSGEVAFEVPCPKCDAPVEFFRDETSARCSKCGHRFPNPRLSFDCGKWCSFADQCLGRVPEVQPATDPGEGALAGLLIRAVKAALGTDQARITRALMVFHQARELLAVEGGDPRVVLAAALLLEFGRGQSDGPAKARQTLEDVGLDRDTADCVWHIIDSQRAGKQPDTIEAKIVADAELLASLAAEHTATDLDRLREKAEDGLKTESARQRARRLLQNPSKTPAR
jgi:hypothetical protein